jgi:hypothetical protein
MRFGLDSLDSVPDEHAGIIFKHQMQKGSGNTSSSPADSDVLLNKDMRHCNE